jgi:glycosyltransferase involved in cell wall biosynthesis
VNAKDNKPLISIGLPVYNGENYVRQALDSLLAQDYESFELIISDNASTDATQQICFEYTSQDPRIRYHRNEVNVGLYNNFTRVFELSSGEYFMWAAHDDLWEPDCVSRCAEVLRENPSVVLCYPQVKFIWPNGELIEEFPFPSFDTRAKGMDLISRFHVHIWGITYPYLIQGLIRSNALKRTRLIRDTLGAELILLTELSLLGEFAHIPELLLYNRLPRHDNWLDQVDAIFKKIDKPVTTKWSALYWFWQMVYGHVQAINRHIPGYRGKAILIPSVVFCVLIKYRWLLKALLDLSKRKQGNESSS